MSARGPSADGPSVSVSPALIIPLLWFMRISSRSLSAWASHGAIDADSLELMSGNPVDRMFFIVLMVAGIVVLVRRPLDWGMLIKKNAFFFLLYAFMGFSVLWSDYQAIAFKRWSRVLGDLIMVLVVLTDTNACAAFAALIRRCAFIHIPLSIFLIKYMRNLGTLIDKHDRNNMWVGVSTHRNALGQLALVVGLYFVWDALRNPAGKSRPLAIVFLAMTGFLLNGGGYSRSATAIIALCIGTAVLFGLNAMRNSIERITSVLAIALVVFIVAQFSSELLFGKPAVDLIVQAAGRDMTFSGRVDLWNDLMYLASHRMFEGYGYGSFWLGDRLESLWETYPWRPAQAHSGYIEAYLNIGLIGLSLLAAALLGSYRAIARSLKQDFDFGIMRLTMFIIILFHNITEASLTRATHILWFVLLLVAIDTRAIRADGPRGDSGPSPAGPDPQADAWPYAPAGIQQPARTL